MVIKTVTYIKGILGTNDVLYDGKFQVAFIGRSNVGKSSTINSLFGKTIARSSKHPGRTKRIDFFLINKSFYFVDLPGYGYANVPEEKRIKIRKMISWYLFRSEVKQRLVVLIIDAVIGLTDFDWETIGMLKGQRVPFIVVANKIDKFAMGKKQRVLDQLHKELRGETIIPYSAKLQKGRVELLSALEGFIHQSVPQNATAPESIR